MEGWQRRQQPVFFVCGQCGPQDDGPSWVRALRRSLRKILGPGALAVVVSGCMGSCPEGETAVLLVNPQQGCWQRALGPQAEPRTITRQLSAPLCHPSVGLHRVSRVRRHHLDGSAGRAYKHEHGLVAAQSTVSSVIGASLVRATVPVSTEVSTPVTHDGTDSLVHLHMHIRTRANRSPVGCGTN
jgi:hypothetical protein